ncbi:MAG: alanine--tRNA ligase-related protein, partial [Patescibacteria group bacterium]
MITTNDLREKFINFFEKKGHVVIPSASLIPENDPSVLFTT